MQYTALSNQILIGLKLFNKTNNSQMDTVNIHDIHTRFPYMAILVQSSNMAIWLNRPQFRLMMVIRFVNALLS